MRKIFYCFFTLLMSLSYGQIAPESHYFSSVYGLYKASPVLEEVIPLENFTQTKLYYTHNEGELRLRQTPASEDSFGLSTHGLFTLKGIKLLGDMQIERSYQGDKKWNLSVNDIYKTGIMPEPHYLAVSKGAKWNNQRYDIYATVVFPIFKRWNIAIDTRYNLKEHYRYEYDPRPKILVYNIGFDGHIGIPLSNKMKAFIGGNYAHKKVSLNIKRSEAEQDTPLYYDKYMRMHQGYGMLVLRQGETSKQVEQEYSTQGGVQFSHNNSTYMIGVKHKNYITDTYKNNQEDELKSDIIATYNKKELVVWGSYHSRLSDDVSLLLQMSYQQNKGDNSLSMQRGQSYQYKQTTYDINAVLHHKQEELYQEAGISLTRSLPKQTDTLSQTATEHTSTEVSVWGVKQIQLGKWVIIPECRLSLNLMQHSLMNNNTHYYTLATDKDYALKAIKLFYDEVVYPDHYYLNKNQYSGTLHFDFKRPISTTTTCILGVESSLRTNGKAQESTLSFNVKFLY